MTLIDNWRRTLTHGYSAWCTYVAISIGAAQEALPYLTEVIPWWSSLAIVGAGLGLRLIKQKTVSGKAEDDDE